MDVSTALGKHIYVRPCVVNRAVVGRFTRGGGAQQTELPAQGFHVVGAG